MHLPGGLVTQFCSSELSPQSLSESHTHVLSMHFLLSHWNSFGSQPNGSERIKGFTDNKMIYCNIGKEKHM